MIVQRQDYLLVDGERRRIAAAAPMAFAPIEFGLRLGGSPSNCTRAFWVDFALNGDEFKIKELWIFPDPEDRGAMLRGKLFDRGPDHVDDTSMTFRDISLPYSGKLLVDGQEEALVPSWQQDVHEVFHFGNGRFKSREKVKWQELPDEFIPSSVWLDYGSMLWLPPHSTQVENA